MKKELTRKDRREEVIFIAEELIRERGVNGFSFADIADQLGIKTPAIHHYFPAKADLVQMVIIYETNRIYDYREQHAHLSGNQQLWYLVSVYVRNSLLHKVCLMGALLGEYATFDFHLQSAVQGLYIRILEWVEDILEKGKADGSLRFKGEPHLRAKMVLALLSSGLLLNRVLEDEGEFECILQQTLADLGVNWRITDLGRTEPAAKAQIPLHSYT